MLQPAPRVSVIVRTKDRPSLLSEALGSLSAQTFGDFEVLVVNDGGTPPANLPAAGREVRVVTTDAPHGRTRALNCGLANARGRFVAYLDDDDLWLPEHLATLERFLSGTDAYGAAFTDTRVVLQRLGRDGKYADERVLTVYGAPFRRARLLSSNTVPLIALMHDREAALAAGGYDEAFDLFEDWDFLLRLSKKTRFHHLPGVTAVYRLREDGTNATTAVPWHSAGSNAARVQVFRKHWSEHSPTTQADLVDALLGEADEARAAGERALAELRSRTDTELRERAEALAAKDAEAAGLHAALDAATAESAAAATRVRESAAREQRAAEEALLVRADAARQLQAAGEREAALAARAAELERQLAAVRGTRAFRVAERWWKLKGLLAR